LPEARQEKGRLEKELTPKEIQKGKAKVIEWNLQHRPLVLKQQPLSVN
jgi:hypothetical protein